jgi:hypothetical protein
MIRKTMTAVALSASRLSRINTLGLSFCPSSPSGLVLAVEEIGIRDDERPRSWFGIGIRLRYFGVEQLVEMRVRGSMRDTMARGAILRVSLSPEIWSGPSGALQGCRSRRRDLPPYRFPATLHGPA